MSSLTNQSSSTKSLTGLSDTYSTNIVCDTLEVADEFTCDPGCVITLPPASIQDSYLTSNVAFRNQVNSFTLANNFASTTTHNGTTTNNGTSNFNSTMNVTNGSIQNFYSTGGTSNSRLQQTASSFQIVNGTNNQAIILSTRTSGGSPVSNLVCQNGNTAYLQGDASNRITVSGSTTPTISTQAPLSSNNLSIVNSAWVVSQAFAKLAGPQTFTGDQNFPTQLTTDNSTLVATTAYVKNQGYATTASLSAYAQLAGTQTFTGTNTFNALTISNAIYRNFQSIQAVFPADFRILDSTQTRLTQLYQNGTTCVIDGNFASSKLQFSTRDASSIPINNLVMELGNRCYLQGAAGLGIGMVGSAISLDGVCSFTNTTTPVITQSISLADNSTKIATTAFVKGQNYITSSALTPYALLNPTTTQTFAGTGDNVFSNIATFNVGLQSNNNITLFSIGGGGQTSNIQQNNSGLTIRNISNSNSIILETRTSGGVAVENIKCQNGTDTTIRGSLTMLNEKIDMNANPIRFVDGLTSSKISQSGNALIIENISNVSSVQIRSTTAGLVQRTGVTVQNGNETIIQGGSTGIIRVLGNDATIECDNFKSNAPFECGYLQLGTPITAKTNYDIGYQWSIQGSSFNSWSGFTAYGNVYTLAWNGTGDRTLGVWLCDICIATNTTSAMDSGFVLNITNNFVINTRSAWSNALTSFGVNQAQIVRLSCVLNITNLTDTYYLNFKINGGSARSDIPGASQMLFTRIA